MKRTILYLLILTSSILVYAKSTAVVKAKSPINNKYLLGEYRLKKVVDGDTINVQGLDASIRILFIDTEESFKGAKAYERTKEVAERWDEYLAEQAERAQKSGKPVKFNTPNALEATKWAKDFFKGINSVRLEYDNLDAKRGFYSRYLAYIFVRKNDQWVNFNVEIVRAGYSPYSTKYGRSLRFHNEFVQAQKEAQEKKIGIWNEKGKHYPDYETRLKWWNKRGDQIHHYRNKYKKDFIFLGGSDRAYFQLKKKVGSKVKLFGILRSVKQEGDYLSFLLPVKQFVDITVEVNKKSGFKYEDLKEHDDYYVYLIGILKEDAAGKFFIEVTSPKQIFFK